MKDESETPLEARGDEELEARVLAWILGEASEFEAQELEQRCRREPELALFARRMRHVHGLLGEDARPAADPDWRLSDERRAALLEKLGTPADREPRVLRHFARRAWIGLAACALLGLIAWPLVMRPGSSGRGARMVATSRMELSEELGMAADPRPAARAVATSEPLAEAVGERAAEKRDALNVKGGMTESEALSETLRAQQADSVALISKARTEVVNAKPSQPEGRLLASNGAGQALRPLSEPGLPTDAPRQGVPEELAHLFDAGGTALSRPDSSVSPDLAKTWFDSDGGQFDAYFAAPQEEAAPVDAFAAGPELETQALAAGFDDAVAALGADVAAPTGGEESRRRSLALGDGMLELGRAKDAQTEFSRVLEKDPGNVAARRGLERAQLASRDYYYRASTDQARAETLIETDSAWELSVPDSERVAGKAAEVTGAASLRSKLQSIVIPEVDFENMPVDEALEFLKQQTAELDGLDLDPNRRGVEFELTKPGAARLGEEAEGFTPEIAQLKLRNVPLGETLDYIAESTRMRWDLTEEGIAFRPATEMAEDLVTRTFTVPPDFLQQISGIGDRGEEGEVDPFAPAGDAVGSSALAPRMTITEALQASGVVFPSDAGAQFFASDGTLVVRNTPANLDLIEQLTEALAASAPSADQPIETPTREEPVSTFSLHVGDASFRLACAALERGERPAPDTVRPEEFYNAFDYGDPAPAADEPVACAIEQSAHPLLPQRNLLRIAVRTGSEGRLPQSPLNLTLLLDNSGSMEREDRAAGVERAVEQLATLLKPGDKVTVAGFARQPRLLAEQLDGAEAGQLAKLVRGIPAEGGTNLEEALGLGEELAMRQFAAAGQNRVVLFTDGAANLGDAEPESLNRRVEEMRQNGIAFDAAGFGADGLNDRLLEWLTRNGNGRYHVVDGPEQADSGFARQLAGAFRPAAENVKVQVRFNPERVRAYRLIGFDEHRLAEEDFRNDAVDAAELAAEEAGVALYQCELLPEGRGELGEVALRFRDAASGAMVERSWTLPYDARLPSFSEASPSLQLAGLAALSAQQLRGEPGAGPGELPELAQVIDGVRRHFSGSAPVRHLLTMVETLRAP